MLRHTRHVIWLAMSGCVLSQVLALEPSLGQLTLTPASPMAGDEIRCEILLSARADGRAAPTLSWTIDGETAGSGATLSEGFERGDEVSCHAVDSVDPSAWAPLSSSVRVVNAPPAVSGAVTIPAAPTSADAVDCDATTSDPDGDTVLLEVDWTVDAEAALGPTLAAGAGSRGSTLTCTLTPHDGTTTGAPITTSVIVGNALPRRASSAWSRPR